ncbi:dockerin type I domain-containing protein [Ruminococcus sp.]
MKRRIARFITFCIVTMMLLAPSVSKVYAGPAAGDTYVLEYDKDEETHVSLNPDKATVKPTLSLTKLQVPVNQAKWTYTIELTVSGAEKKYAPTGIHVRFDDRLQLQLAEEEDYAEPGPAASKLGHKQCPDYIDENGTPHGLFLSTSCGNGNNGKDGVFWEFTIKLPSDAKVGDKYPVEIVYQVNKENAMLHDIFTNLADDKDGKNMEAWVFTKGIEQGYIEITEAKPITGDLNGDGILDASDASILLMRYAQYSIGAATPTEEDLALSDVNKDGMIDAIDASWLLAYYAAVSTGKEMRFEDFYKEMKNS